MTLPILRESADVVRLFDPATGEEVDPHTATTDKLAELRDALRDYDETAKMAKKRIDTVLLSRMDAEAQWTVRVNGFKLTAPSPEPEVQYDGEALYEALARLAADGAISWDAVAEAVERKTVYRPVKAKLSKLRKLGGAVREAIDAHAEEVDRDRRVRVSRA